MLSYSYNLAFKARGLAFEETVKYYKLHELCYQGIIWLIFYIGLIFFLLNLTTY